MSWIVAGDMGKRKDPATIAVCQRVTKVRGDATPGPGIYIGHSTPEVVYTELDFVMLEEFPLGTTYRDIVARHKDIVTDKEVFRNVDHLVDATGVGEAVLEMMHIDLPDCIGLYFTGGDRVREGKTKTELFVPKRDIAMSLLLWHQHDRIHVNQGHDRTRDGRRQAEVFQRYEEQLSKFKEKIKTTHHTVWENESDADHDDLVIAVAMACWWAQMHYGFETPVDAEDEFPAKTQEAYDPFSQLRGE